MEIALLGNWWDPDEPDRVFPGELTWSGGTWPTLRVLAHLPYPRFGQIITDETKMAVLWGDVADRGAVSLFDLRNVAEKSSSRGPSQSTLTADLALVGVHSRSAMERRFRFAQVEIPAIKRFMEPRSPFQVTVDRESGITKVEELEQGGSWRVRQTSLTLRFSHGFRRDSEGISHSYAAVAEFQSARPKSVDEWMSLHADSLNQLTALFIGERSLIDSLTLLPDKVPTANSMRDEVTVLSGGIGHASRSEPLRNEKFVSLDQIEADSLNLLQMVKSYGDFRKQNALLVDQLLSCLYSGSRPLRNQLLDLTSGLESFHFARFGSKNRKRTTKKGAVASYELHERLNELAFMYLGSRKRWPADTHIAVLSPSQRRSWSNCGRRIGQLRNSVAHGKRKVEDRDLRIAVRHLLDLCRRLVLLELSKP